MRTRMWLVTVMAMVILWLGTGGGGVVMAAPAYVQRVGDANDSTTALTLTLASPVTIGNTLIVCTRNSSAEDGTVSSTGANWTRVVQEYELDWVLEIHVATNVQNSDQTIVVNVAGPADAVRAWVTEYSGVRGYSGTNPVHRSVSANSTRESSPANAGSFTTTVANCLLYCAVATDTDLLGFSAGSGWTLRGPATDANDKIVSEDRVVSSTGTYSGLMTLTPDSWAAGMIALIADSETPPTDPVISISPTSLDYGLVQNGTTSNKVIIVQNSGGGTLSGSASVAAPFSIVSGANYDLGASATQHVVVRFTPGTVQLGPTNKTVTFTGGGGTTAAVSGRTPLGLTFGAHQGIITAPYVINGDNSISQAPATSEPDTGGSAVFDFKVVAAGNYKVTAEVDAVDAGANSCFIQMDGQPTSPDHIWDTPVTVGFASHDATWRLLSGSTKVWTLSSGLHQLIIRGREADLKIKGISVVGTDPPASATRLRATIQKVSTLDLE